MNFFYDMSLKLKFIVSFSIVLFLTLLVAYIGYAGLSDCSQAQDELATNRAPSLKYLGEMGATINSVAVGERGLGLGKFFDDPTARNEQFKSIEEGLNYFNSIKSQYELLPKTEIEKGMWDEFLNYYSSWKKYHDEFVGLSRDKVELVTNNSGNSSQIDSIDGLMDDLLVNSRQSFDNSISQIRKLSSYYWDEVQRIDKETDEATQADFSILIYISLLAVLFAALIGVILTFAIAVPLKKITMASDIIAAGDFNYVIETFNRKDEIGKLSLSLKAMTKNVTDKAFWYEQILDAIPFPLSVTDNNMSWTFINKPVEQLLKVRRKDILGKQCNNWGAAICKTEKCGVEGLRRGIGQTFFEQFGGYYQVDSTYLHDSEGKQIGHIELVQDITKAKSNELYLAESARKMIAEMELFSKGDLTVSLTSEKDDDIGRLFNSFNASVRNIAQLVVELIEVVEATASATAQISSSTEEMAAGAQEQSAQTSEVAGAVEEMTRTIIDTTKNTSMAAESSKQSAGKAREGGKIVSDAVHGMNQIANVVELSAKKIFTLGQNSDKIGEIVQVIDEIADQTNLLALNAAIEAARAGEQGRGFAVVADEVRKLAERTTKATKEIAAMIKQIQVDTNDAVESMKQGTENVENGKKLVNKAGEVLTEIIKSSEKVTDVIVQVAAASEEQSATSEEISKNVEAINSVTQETTSGIQQIARAAEDLNRLTSKLQDIAGNFRVEVSKADNKVQGRRLIGR